MIILRYSIALHWRVFPTTRGLRNFHGHGARGGQRLVVERVVDVVVVVGGGGGRGFAGSDGEVQVTSICNGLHSKHVGFKLFQKMHH